MEINIYSTHFDGSEVAKIKEFIIEFIKENFKDISYYQPLEFRIVDDVLVEQSSLINRPTPLGSPKISGCYLYLNNSYYIVLDSFLFVMFSRLVLENNIDGNIINIDYSNSNRNNAIYHEVIHMVIDKKRNTQKLPYTFDANTSRETIINIFAERLYQEHEAVYLSQQMYPISTNEAAESLREYLKDNSEISDISSLMYFLNQLILNQLIYVIAGDNVHGDFCISDNVMRIISEAKGNTKEHLAWFCGHCILLQKRDIDVDNWVNRIVNWLATL